MLYSRQCLQSPYLALNQLHVVCETAAETVCYFLQRMRLAVLCGCQYLPAFYLYEYLHVLHLNSCLIWFVLWNLDWQRSDRLHVTGCTTVFDSAALAYTMWESSLETPVIQFLDKMCLGTWKEVGVTFRINVNMHLEVTITQNVLWQCHKTKKFTHCRLLFKHVAHLFLHHMKT